MDPLPPAPVVLPPLPIKPPAPVDAPVLVAPPAPVDPVDDAPGPPVCWISVELLPPHPTQPVAAPTRPTMPPQRAKTFMTVNSPPEDERRRAFTLSLSE
jgi:hypothetical protein